MPKVKNTVQAQRKFAQGAVVPAQPERRAEPAPTAPPPPPPEPRDVRHCGMPATQLLNLIVMRNIHPHVPVTETQPVVLLERLNANNESNDNVKKVPKKKKKKKLVNQNEPPLKQATTTRSLRSRAVNTIEERKRRRSESSGTDVEDNRPLKFLSKNNQEKNNQDKINQDAQKKKISTSSPKCRVSQRQLNQRKNKATQNEAKRKIEKTPMSTNITKAVRVRKKRSSRLPSSTSRERAGNAPYTRARHDATAASAPSSQEVRHISPGPATPEAVRVRKKRSSRLPPSTSRERAATAPYTRARHDATVASAPVPQGVRHISPGPAVLERSPEKLNTPSMIAKIDTEQQPEELERVIGELVDRAQRSPSRQPPACPAPSNDTSAAAAPDVYVFNEETEMEAEPSPFRAPRPRQPRSRAHNHQQRAMSLDPTLMGRETDTNCIIRVLDVQTKLLSSYVKGRDSDSDKQVKNISKLIHIVDRYKNILQHDSTQTDPSTTAQATPTEIVVIDDDDPKQEPLGEVAANTEMPRLLLPSELSDDDDGPEIADAPTFYPTTEEMKDLNYYVETIEPVARKYGIFKIVPPREFQPPCQLMNVQFKCNNQYVSSMYSRWGPTTREMTAIKAFLGTQGVSFTHPPLWGGVEFDLVKLFQLVQEHGGLVNIVDDKWSAIADEMHMNTRGGHLKSNLWLDKTFMKYLLPYDALSEVERKSIRALVTTSWQKRYCRQLARGARTPLHRQRRILGESESSGEDEEPESSNLKTAFHGVEDCVVPGSNMNLTQFQRVAEHVRDMWFPDASAGAPPHWAAVERAYWRLVHKGTEHVCVHSAALDTSQYALDTSQDPHDTSQDAFGFPAAVDALGFPASVDAPYGNHPWNLKRLGESDRNVLSSLGPTLAVTVPTLHLGMIFSTNCWHHDPHHLPWTEFMHQGPPKIWYGIADSESGAFRTAVEKLCPLAVQNKGLWLPSDTAMLPPRLLAAHGVRMVRALQAPGEYVVVLPGAFSCSISTGFTVSESLYFAGDTWLDGVDRVFAALRADAEPSMFSLEALLEGVVRNPAAKTSRLLRARAILFPLLRDEIRRRREATALGVRALSKCDFLKENRRCSMTSWQVACNECHVCRATLHWSKMIEVTSSMSLCLEHGLQLVHGRNIGRGAKPAVDGPSTSAEPTTPDTFFVILFYTQQEITQLSAEIDKLLSK